MQIFATGATAPPGPGPKHSGNIQKGIQLQDIPISNTSKCFKWAVWDFLDLAILWIRCPIEGGGSGLARVDLA